jgi:hypothetical protein
MTIDQAYQFILFVANKEQRGVIPPEKFNVLAPIMQMSVVNDMLGNLTKYKEHDPVPNIGTHISQKWREDLRVLFKNAPVTVNSSTGVGAYPTDALYIDTINVTSTGKLVTEVTMDEYRRLTSSQIKPPTADYPVYVLRGSTIIVSPAVNVDVYYIRKPTTAKWNFTGDEVPVYASSGSQDFEVSDTLHLLICNKILAAVGVNLDNDKIMAYAGMEINSGS